MQLCLKALENARNILLFYSAFVNVLYSHMGIIFN